MRAVCPVLVHNGRPFAIEEVDIPRVVLLNFRRDGYI